MDTEQQAALRRPWTVPMLAEAKQTGHKLTMLTAYDASFGRAMDRAGLDMILIGDSLGMVMQGHDSTLPVTVDQIEYHTACVAKAAVNPMIVADLPFQADADTDRALQAATRFLQAGAKMVKIEGAGFKCDIIRYLSEREIPVCSHLGLTPQSILRLGSYKVQGRDDAAAAALLQQAKDVEQAGADLLVLECVPSALAAEITKSLTIPTIGIGAGPDCDGQVLVLHDMLGMDSGHRRPRFVKDFLAVGGSIEGAIAAYIEAVQNGDFPAPEHGYA